MDPRCGVFTRATRNLLGGGVGGLGSPRMVAGSENGLPSPRANFICFYAMLMGEFFFGKQILPLVYVQNGQRVMGIILRYVCGATHRTPPPSPPDALSDTPHPWWRGWGWKMGTEGFSRPSTQFSHRPANKLFPHRLWTSNVDMWTISS